MALFSVSDYRWFILHYFDGYSVVAIWIFRVGSNSKTVMSVIMFKFV